MTSTALQAQETAPRSIREIIEDLSKPLDPRHLKTRKQGSTNLTYIEWHTAVKYLDLFAPGWAYHVPSVQLVGNLVTVVASISIPCAEGIVTREATGCEESDAKGYGDALSNSEAMALKRAASKFGLGLYLYDKDSKGAPTPGAAMLEQEQQRARQAAPSNGPSRKAVFNRKHNEEIGARFDELVKQLTIRGIKGEEMLREANVMLHDSGRPQVKTRYDADDESAAIICNGFEAWIQILDREKVKDLGI